MYSYHNVHKAIKSRTVRWVGHVVYAWLHKKILQEVQWEISREETTWEN
jgi:hypothetical protein